MSFITHFVSTSPAAYAVVFGVVAVDALIPFVQAEAVVITAAVLAAQGHLWIWLIVPVVALAGFIGDNAAYFIGRRVGCHVAGRFVRRRRLEQAQKGVRRRGGVLIVIARFLPVGRTLTTLAAGTLEMPWPRFARADAVAAAAWGVYASMLGYAGGASFQDSIWKPLVFSFGVALALGLATEAYRRVQKRRGRELLTGDLR